MRASRGRDRDRGDVPDRGHRLRQRGHPRWTVRPAGGESTLHPNRRGPPMNRQILLLSAMFAAPLAAQGEEEHLPFVEAKAAFERASAEGKRVLVYQDWPG